MTEAWLADAVLLLHGLFIAWAVLGALAVAWRAWLALAHLPAAAWALWISWRGGYCPLTPIEQSLRRAAGQAGYEGSFIEHYLTPAIYPAGLTASDQALFGTVVLAINLLIYAGVIRRAARRRRIA